MMRNVYLLVLVRFVTGQFPTAHNEQPYQHPDPYQRHNQYPNSFHPNDYSGMQYPSSQYNNYIPPPPPLPTVKKPKTKAVLTHRLVVKPILLRFLSTYYKPTWKRVLCDPLDPTCGRQDTVADRLSSARNIYPKQDYPIHKGPLPSDYYNGASPPGYHSRVPPPGASSYPKRALPLGALVYPYEKQDGEVSSFTSRAPSGSGGAPGFPNNVPSAGAPRFPNGAPPSGGTLNYANEGPSEGASGFSKGVPHAEAPSYPNKSPYSGDSGYLNKAPYSGDSSYPNRAPSRGAGFPNEAPPVGAASYPNKTPYSGAPDYTNGESYSKDSGNSNRSSGAPSYPNKGYSKSAPEISSLEPQNFNKGQSGYQNRQQSSYQPPQTFGVEGRQKKKMLPDQE